MKTLFLTFISFISLFAMGQSNLTVFNNGGQKFYLIMNGIKQNSVAQTNVVVSGIKNGGYSVKLIFEDGKTKDIEKNFYLDAPQEITTRVIFKKGAGKLQLVSMEPSNGNVAVGSVTYRPDNNAVFSDAVTSTTTTTTTQTTTESTTTGGGVQGNGNGSMGIQVVESTAPTPGNAGGSNNGGVQMNVNATQNQTNNQQVGNGGVTISLTDPVNGENINMNFNMNVNGTTVDPNAQNVNMNVNVSGNGNQQNSGNTRPGANANVNVGTSTNSTTQQTTTNGANVNVNVSGNGVNPSVIATVPGATTNVTVNGGTVTQNSSNTTITTTTTTTTNSSTTTNGGSNVGNVTSTNMTGTGGGTSNGRMVCSKTLSNVETLKTELKGYSFEDDRVGALKISLKNKCLYAADAVKVMDLFTFDANQLEVAKFLSDHLLDYDNASSLASKFTFDSSKMEYMEYIGRD